MHCLSAVGHCLKKSFATVRVRAWSDATEAVDSGRNIRRSLNQTGRYTRQPKDEPQSAELMEQHGVGYSSTGLVAQMRDNNNTWQQGEVRVKLAKAYGYCWGVERAVRMAYEARQAFPNRKVHITNEIIHNPEVNQVRSMHGAYALVVRPCVIHNVIGKPDARRWWHVCMGQPGFRMGCR